jgi:hypothetical protein
VIVGKACDVATKVYRESDRRRRLNRQLGLVADGPPPSLRNWVISGAVAGITAGLLVQLFNARRFSVSLFIFLAAMWFVFYGPFMYAVSLHRWRVARRVMQDEPWPSREHDE